MPSNIAETLEYSSALSGLEHTFAFTIKLNTTRPNRSERTTMENTVEANSVPFEEKSYYIIV